MRYQFTSIGRDLFVQVPCMCVWPDTDVPRPMRLTGYADDYFFDRVNAEPRTVTCKCGLSFAFQWRRDGVDIEPVATTPTAMATEG